MTQLKDLIACEGKTIVKAHQDSCPDQVIIVFDDKTFITVVCRDGYYGEHGLEVGGNFDVMNNPKLSVQLGIVTLEEVLAIKRERDERESAATRAHELKEFARLKQKFAKGDQ